MILKDGYFKKLGILTDNYVLLAHGGHKIWSEAYNEVSSLVARDSNSYVNLNYINYYPSVEYDMTTAVKSPVDSAKMLITNGSDNYLRKSNQAGIRYFVRVPWGFYSWDNTSSWGNTTGTNIATWNESDGGSIQFMKNNPSSGKLSVKVDGRFYINEGTYPVMGMNYNNSYWGVGGPDAQYNTWIRTTTSGFIPEESGGEWSGHSSLGTSTWYFGNIYSQYVNNIHFKGITVNNSTSWSDNKYTKEIFGDTNNIDYKLSVIRTNAYAPIQVLDNYSSGISWKGADTYGAITNSYSTYDSSINVNNKQGKIRFLGGNNDNPIWYFTLYGTNTISYNLDNMPIYVQQHTSNNINYPLIWSNENNTNSISSVGQLYKSYDNIVYNPYYKRIILKGNNNSSSNNSYMMKIIQGTDNGSGIYDTFIISSNDCPGFRISESDGTQLGLSAGDSHTTFISTHDFRFYTGATSNTSIYSGSNGKSRLRITNSGTYIDGNSTNVNHIYLTGYNNTSTSNTTQIVFGSDSSNHHIALSSNANKLIINPSISSTTGQIELGVNGARTYFSSSGKFLIGTTNEIYKLEVGGDIRSTGFRHNAVNSDSYVLLAGGGYKEISSFFDEYSIYDNNSSGKIGIKLNIGENTKYVYPNWLNKYDSNPKFGYSGLQYFDKYSDSRGTNNTSGTPTNDWYHIIRMNHPNSSGYFVELAASFHDNSLWYRRISSGTLQNSTNGYGGWIRILDELTESSSSKYLLRLRRENLNESITNTGQIPPAIFELMNGKALHPSDPTFISSTNNISKYNNAGDNTTVTRITDNQSSGNGSGYILQIQTTGITYTNSYGNYSPDTSIVQPNLGGFCFQDQSGEGKVIITIFRAKIPSGYWLSYHNNNNYGTYGTGDVNSTWLTKTEGTGKWEWYAHQLTCGTTGTFSTVGYFSLTCNYNTLRPTSITWYLSFANSYLPNSPSNISDYYWANQKLQTSSSNTTVPSFGAIRMNGVSSAGENYITGYAGRIYFGGNFHIDSLGSNATYINYYSANNVYMVTGGGKVGIGTVSPSYKLHINGDSYSTEWSRAGNGFYIEGQGVYYRNYGTRGWLYQSNNNEFCITSTNSSFYINYASANAGTVPTDYIWNSGSSSSYANHIMKSIELKGGWIEIYGTDPYIDFHKDNYSGDYSARLINLSGTYRLAQQSASTMYNGYLSTVEGNIYNIVCLGIVCVYKMSDNNNTWYRDNISGLIELDIKHQPKDQYFEYNGNPAYQQQALIVEVKSKSYISSETTKTTVNVCSAIGVVESTWWNNIKVIGRVEGTERNTAYNAIEIAILSSINIGGYNNVSSSGKYLSITARRPCGDNDNDNIGLVQFDGLLETGNGSIASIRITIFGYMS